LKVTYYCTCYGVLVLLRWTDVGRLWQTTTRDEQEFAPPAATRACYIACVTLLYMYVFMPVLA